MTCIYMVRLIFKYYTHISKSIRTEGISFKKPNFQKIKINQQFIKCDQLRKRLKLAISKRLKFAKQYFNKIEEYWNVIILLIKINLFIFVSDGNMMWY